MAVDLVRCQRSLSTAFKLARKWKQEIIPRLEPIKTSWNIQEREIQKITGKSGTFGRQFNYRSWWDGNLTLHLHAGETVFTVIAIPHVSAVMLGRGYSSFITTRPHRLSVLLSPPPSSDQRCVQIRKDKSASISDEDRAEMGWWENDIFIRGFVRLGFSVWGQERLQRHMPSIRAKLMRIICSQRVRGQGWGHLIPQKDRESLKAPMMSHAQERQHTYSPTNNPSAHPADRSQNRNSESFPKFPFR